MTPESNTSDLTATVRVLVVDDEEAICRVFSRLAVRALPGAQVRSAANGQVAVELYREEPADIVLLDLRMPVMDGYSAYTAIMSYAEEVDLRPPKVIFCSGYAPPRVVEDLARGDGAPLLLRKPVGAAELTQCLQSCLKDE